jgi:HAD superfamily hydrolase (TIGR01509 family)
MLQAVLIDLEGTVVDTEPVWAVAARGLAHRLGGQLSDSALTATVGITLTETVRIVLGDVGASLDDVTIRRCTNEITREVAAEFGRGVPWQPGARAFLGNVTAAGLPLALVTSTDRALTEIILRTVGRERFKAIVCGDEVNGRTKPDPTPYLEAARLLGVDATRCVAVDDSPAGVKSARAAGCAVLCVPYPGETVPRDGHTTVLPSLAGVTVDLLRALVQ